MVFNNTGEQAVTPVDKQKALPHYCPMLPNGNIATMKTMLTDRGLKAAKPAVSGTRTMVWDSAIPSFGVRISEHGKKTFIVMRRLHGKLVRRTIGQYPIMTLSAAREAALEALRDIERGIDPKEKKAAQRRAEAQRRANSFTSVAEDFIARHVSKLRSAHDIEAAIRRELISRWGERPIADLTRRDVISLIEAISDDGRPAMARRIFAHLTKLFSWAIVRSTYGLETSPCVAVKPAALIGAQEPRQRVLNEAEIRAVWRATEGLGYPAGLFCSHAAFDRPAATRSR